jgi:hypothetical protein
MFPTFYVLLVLVVFPSDHLKTWDATTLKAQTDTKTFPMPDEKTCNQTASRYHALADYGGDFPEGTFVITRCHTVASHDTTS